MIEGSDLAAFGCSANQEPATQPQDKVNFTESIVIRQASPADLSTVQEISAEASIPAYKAVVGSVPKPAMEDYLPRIARGEPWLLEADRGPARSIWSCEWNSGPKTHPDSGSFRDMTRLLPRVSTPRGSKPCVLGHSFTPILGWAKGSFSRPESCLF
jgi:hypothetical protein